MKHLHDTAARMETACMGSSVTQPGLRREADRRTGAVVYSRHQQDTSTCLSAVWRGVSSLSSPSTRPESLAGSGCLFAG